MAIIHALGLLKDRKSAPRLYNHLKNPSSKVRLSVVIALGNIGDTASAGALKEALQDFEPNVVWDASVSLEITNNTIFSEIGNLHLPGPGHALHRQALSHGPCPDLGLKIRRKNGSGKVQRAWMGAAHMGSMEFQRM